MTTRFPALRLLVFLLLGFLLPWNVRTTPCLGETILCLLGGSLAAGLLLFLLARLVRLTRSPGTVDDQKLQKSPSLVTNSSVCPPKRPHVWAVCLSRFSAWQIGPLEPSCTTDILQCFGFCLLLSLGLCTGAMLRFTHCVDAPMIENAKRSEVPALAEGCIVEALGTSELSDQFVADAWIYSPSLPKHKCRLLLRVPKQESSPRLQTGTHFQVNVALRLPQSQLLCTDWDELNYCRSRELLWIARAYPASLSRDYRRVSNVSFRDAIRDWVEGAIARCFVPSSQSLAASVLFADTRSLDEDLVQSLQQSGIYHLMLSSTMHVVLAALCLQVFCAWIPWRIPRLVVFALGLCVPLMLSAWSPTPLRTALLLLILQILRVVQRSASRLNVVAFLCLTILVVDPASLFHPGLQLSVSAVLSYHIFYNRTNKLFHLVLTSRTRVLGWLHRALSGAVATTLLLAPLIALHSNAYHFLSPLVGIVLSVPGVLCSACVFLAVLLEPIWHGAACSVAGLAQEIMQILWFSADMLGGVPILQLFAPTAWIVGTCCSICFFTLFVCTTRRGVLIVGLSCLLTIASCMLCAKSWQDDLHLRRSHLQVQAVRLHSGIEYFRFVSNRNSAIASQHDKALSTFFTMFDADTLVIDASDKHKVLIESIRESVDDKVILEIRP